VRDVLKTDTRVELLRGANILTVLMTVLITFVLLVDRQWILAILAAVGGTVIELLVIGKAWPESFKEGSPKTDVKRADKPMLFAGIAVTFLGWAMMLTSSGYFSSIQQGSPIAGGIGVAGVATLIVGYSILMIAVSWQQQKMKGTRP